MSRLSEVKESIRWQEQITKAMIEDNVEIKQINLSCINKQLVDISVTLAMMLDKLGKLEICEDCANKVIYKRKKEND